MNIWLNAISLIQNIAKCLMKIDLVLFETT